MTIEPQSLTPLNLLAAGFLEVCKLRGWDLNWTARGAYLHLEASELIEAIRGKRGSPKSEAADVLLVLMSITENAGIPFSEVFRQAMETCSNLRERPRYAGEEYSQSETGGAFAGDCGCLSGKTSECRSDWLQ